jgi:hypothetical protein
MVDDKFGYWFSGYFSGEGCLVASLGSKNLPMIGATIMISAVDVEILEFIREQTGIGAVATFKKANGRSYSEWRTHDRIELATVIIPLFDRYPLLGKKSREFEIWRELVLYMADNSSSPRTRTLPVITPMINAIKEIRHE